MDGINVLSLFDGMSCGRIALERAEIKVNNYFASEIDKHAIKVTQTNYPNTIQLGDVTKVKGSDLPKIDLLCGGSPCQGFSFAGKGLNFEDPRSKLFFEFVRLKNETKPKYFLLENVVMKKEHEKVISEFLGVEPILINSNLVSAQNRKRLYWTNISGITQPVDKGITWGDVREHGIELGAMYYTDKAMEWIGKHGTRKGKPLKIHADNEKMQMLEASHHKKYSSQRFFGIIDQPAQITGRRLNEFGKREGYNKNIKTTQCLEVRGGDKVNCLTTVQKDNVISVLPIGRYPDVFKELEEGKHYRYITPIECERLQNVPDNYTDVVSDTQRYKMLGNGWTVSVISHIFSFLPKEYFEIKMSEGKRKLLFGDCLELMKLIPTGSVDLVVTDPPYEIEDMKPYFAEMLRCLSKDGSIYVFGNKNMIAEHWFSQMKIDKKELLIWHYKNSPKPKGRWRMSMQPIIYGYRGNSIFNEDAVRVEYNESTKKLNGRIRPSSGRMDKCSAYDTSKGALPRDVIERPALLGHLSKERTGHRDQKPLSIITDLVLASSNEGQLILDPFGGSGTTAEVCLRTNRQFITMELEPNNFEKIKVRLEDFNKKFETQTLFGNEM